MTAESIIRSRRSVRTFDGNALTPEELDRIRAAAEKADNPYGIPIRWHILDAKKHGLSSPVIVGEKVYLTGVLPRGPHAEEAFGFGFERLLLSCVEAGFGTVWIAGTLNRKAFEKAVGLREGEIMPCVSPVGRPAEKMSVRETLMRKGAGADARLPFESLFFEGGFNTPLSPEKDPELTRILELIRWAPSAVNKQPWRVVLDGDRFHFYEKHNRGYVSADGWDLQKIDVGIALCHLAMGLEEIGGWSLELADPGGTVPENVEYVATIRRNGRQH